MAWPMPISRACGLRMFSRWRGLFIQAWKTSSADCCPAAMFSPIHVQPV